MANEKVSASVVIAVPAAGLFAVLADPRSHAAIDGSGRSASGGIGGIQEPVDTAPLAELGQVFRMHMYHPRHPDGDYRTANKIIAFDPPYAIGWLTGTENDDGELEFGGWFWRYDLAPLGPAATQVTLTYDWSAVPDRIRAYLSFPPFAPEHLINSLHRLQDLATGPATHR
ncbi:MAG: hypothetical protein J2P23_05270 [Microlunatus sp.]|nr:hypothetical protein [Microlunatus sp.]